LRNAISNYLANIMITEQQLRQISPFCKEPALWAGLISEHLPRFGLTDREQVARFIAQCGHESSDFNLLKENLNYTAQRLLVVFPKYFKRMSAEELQTYHRNPQRIANLVYANRMGNGDAVSGDGYRYSGKGLIQLTFKTNYAACSEYLFKDDSLVTYPDNLLDPQIALLSAIWFWKANNLDKIADYDAVTKAINGGTHGAADRNARLARAKKALA
jgi:putative chitinase